ncbi:MAG: hypothetical protein ACLQLC_13370 [Candidatus Sulfotelmatobacter sp.]
MLKHCLLALMLAGLIYAVTPSASSQDNGTNAQQAAPAEHGRGHFDPARRTEMLTKRLNLSSDQQSKVLDIYKSAQSQMESLRSDASVPQADRHAKMQEIRKNTDDQVRGVLNSDQQKKFDEMQSRHEQRQQPQQQQQQ